MFNMELYTMTEEEEKEVNTVTEEEMLKYFTKEKLQKACAFEKKRMENEVRNHKALTKMGIFSIAPGSMKRMWHKPSRDDSDSDSDNDWRPQAPKVEKNFCAEVFKKEKQITSPRKMETDEDGPKLEAGENWFMKTREFTGSPDKDVDDSPEKETPKKEEYNLRKVKQVNYSELEMPDEDTFIYCHTCNEEFYGDCPKCGPLNIIEDEKAPADGSCPDRSARTAPPDHIRIDRSTIRGAGKGAFAATRLQENIRFGPYEGKIVSSLDEAHDSGYAWEITKEEGNKSRVYYVDATDESTANWMRYVNCARHEDEQNLAAFQYKGEIYYRTLGTIPKGKELLVWYGKEYAQELGISDRQKAKSRKSFIRRPDRNPAQPLHIQSPQYKTKTLPQTGHKVHTCDVNGCGRIYASLSFLLVHQKLTHGVHVDSTKLKLHCDLCNFSSSHQLGIDKHKKDAHRIDVNQPGYEKSGKHQAVKPRAGNHPCKYCHKAFSIPNDLRRHLRTHTGDKPFKCPECGKGFTQKSNMKKHRRIHSGIKPYKCDVCGKRFNVSTNLTAHKRIHTGEKPYVCNVCGEGFNLGQNLNKHMRIHTGEKPFVCKVCGDSFTRAGSLRDHERIHTGEKPYVCKVCGDSFTVSCNLRYHERRVHAGQA